MSTGSGLRLCWPPARAVELVTVSVETPREASGVTTESEGIVGESGTDGLSAVMSGSQRLDGHLLLGGLVVEAFGFGGDMVLPAPGSVGFECRPPVGVFGGVAVPPARGVRGGALGLGESGAGVRRSTTAFPAAVLP